MVAAVHADCSSASEGLPATLPHGSPLHCQKLLPILLEDHLLSACWPCLQFLCPDGSWLLSWGLYRRPSVPCEPASQTGMLASHMQLTLIDAPRRCPQTGPSCASLTCSQESGFRSLSRSLRWSQTKSHQMQTQMQDQPQAHRQVAAELCNQPVCSHKHMLCVLLKLSGCMSCLASKPRHLLIGLDQHWWA